MEDHVDRHCHQHLSVHLLKSLPVFFRCSIENIKVFKGRSDRKIFSGVYELVQDVGLPELLHSCKLDSEDCKEMEDEETSKYCEGLSQGEVRVKIVFWGCFCIILKGPPVNFSPSEGPVVNRDLIIWLQFSCLARPEGNLLCLVMVEETEQPNEGSEKADDRKKTGG